MVAAVGVIEFQVRCLGDWGMHMMCIHIYGGFRKLWVPFLGVPIIRTIVLWGLY